MAEVEQVVWILALMLAFICAPLWLWRRRERRARRGVPSDPYTPEMSTGHALVPTPASTERSSSGGSWPRRRRPVSDVGSSSSSSASTLVAMSEPEIYDDDGGQGSDHGVVEATAYKHKQSSKKKSRKNNEKEMRREAESAARDMRKEKEERQAQLRSQKDEEREAEERKKEEEAERQKRKEDEAAAAEFDKWKTAISVETEGTQEDVQDEGQGLLNNFVEYIQKHKCVALEALAAEFNLRTQDCINRVMALEQMGRISGVMDERGKFIYISPEEMKAVADYVRRLGRVSISHLAGRSNEFIDLEAKTLASDCAQEASIPAKPHLAGPEISVE